MDTTVDRIVTGCGSVALCQQVVLAVADPGDEVLFGWRSFEAYPIVTQIAGAIPVQVPVNARHALDLAALAAAITPRTRLVFVCTPNNPTGTTVHRGELEQFLDDVPDDVLVVVDEAYREFDTDPDSPDGVEVAARRPNVLALRTLSKAYGLAGLRVGYAVGDPAVVTRSPQGGGAVRGQLGGPGRGHRRAGRTVRTRAAVGAGHRRTAAGHRGPARSSATKCPTSQANFVWLPLEDRAAEFAAHCEEHKVIIRPFSHAGGGGARVTIGAPDENDQFLDAAASYPGRPGA